MTTDPSPMLGLRYGNRPPGLTQQRADAKDRMQDDDILREMANVHSRWRNQMAKEDIVAAVEEFGTPSAIASSPGGVAIWSGMDAFSRVEIHDREVEPWCFFVQYPITPKRVGTLLDVFPDLLLDGSQQRLGVCAHCPKCGAVRLVLVTYVASGKMTPEVAVTSTRRQREYAHERTNGYQLAKAQLATNLMDARMEF